MSANEKYQKRSGPTRAESGLSLIELLVALALGLIIVAALSQLFVNISRTNQEMAKTNSQIENARFAMQFLRDDVVHAGFWNGFVPEFDDLSSILTPTDYPVLPLPDPCLDYASWTDEHIQKLVGMPIEVYTDAGTLGTCGGLIDPRVAGTDVLVIRHAHTCAAGAGNCDDDGSNANRLYFQTSNCADDIDAGDAYALDPNSPLLDKTCDPGAYSPKRKFVQSIYFVRDLTNAAGNIIPTLMRSEFGLTGTTPTQQPADAIVEGIERFRVELGIDNVSESGATLDPNDFEGAIEWEDEDNWIEALNRGDGIPDAYVHCPAARCSLLQLTSAVTAKIYVLARATQPSPGYTDTKKYQLGSAAEIGPFGDAYKRHVFSTTVRLTNVSGRRETP
jgi:type IV pilus assembly protein PilW